MAVWKETLMRFLMPVAAIGFALIVQADSSADYIYRNSFEVECDGVGGCTFCSPANPDPVCGSGSHCTPTADATTVCSYSVGAGTTGSVCTTVSDCGGPYECVNTGGASNTCQKWCPYPSNNTCGAGQSCIALNPPVFVDTAEWGICI